VSAGQLIEVRRADAGPRSNRHDHRVFALDDVSEEIGGDHVIAAGRRAARARGARGLGARGGPFLLSPRSATCEERTGDPG